MVNAIILHSIVPVRAEAREGSEQLTQMLFGETCAILEEKPRWNRVKLDLDGQEGWVDSKMISPMTAKEYAEYQRKVKVIQDYERTLYWCDTPESLDWLDENGFDYRGLLDIGLAVDMKELFEKQI